MFKKFLFLIITLISAIFFLTSNAFATNGMRIMGIGPVQRSMGGVSVGLPLDAASTITNPAGIALVDPRMDFGITFFGPDVKYSAASDFAQITNNNKTINSDTPPSIIPAFGVVLPSDGMFTFGFGAYGVSGMGVDYKKNLYNNVTYSDYAFMKFAPAFAYIVNDRLSLGFAPNLDYATMSYDAGSSAEAAHQGGKSMGYGFTIGALYLASDFLGIGFAYESKQDFNDFEFNTSSGKDKLSFDQPQSATLGFGIIPNDSWLIGFDIMWINWSSTSGKDMPAYSQNSSGASAWNLNWDDQIIYKIGAAYRMNDKITLRAGYNYSKNPLDSSRPFENITFPAIAEQHFTFGAEFALSEQLLLNLGLMYSPEVPMTSSNVPNQFINRATTKMSQFSIDTGIGYKF